MADESERGVLVWPEGLSSAGGDSPRYAVRGPNHNAVIVEITPLGGASSVSLQVIDSDSPNAGFSPTVDAKGATGTLTAADKRVVAGVHKYVRVRALAVSGQWMVKVTPISATNQESINTVVSGTVDQGAPGAGPWPVAPTVADGADATQGDTADAAVVTDAAGTVSGKLRGLVKLLAAAVNLTYGWIVHQPQPCTWNQVGTSAANTAQTVTQAAAGAGVRNYLSGMTVSWSGGAPAAGTNVQIEDGSTVIWDSYIGLNAATIGVNDFEFTQPLRTSANAALNVVVAAAGSGVTTKCSIQGTVGP